MSINQTFKNLWAGPFKLPSLSGPDLLSRQEFWREIFAKRLYGPTPNAPDEITVECEPLPGTSADRLVITVEKDGRRFQTDAALWLPGGQGPHPIVIGLDAVGPVGLLDGVQFPIDRDARIASPHTAGTDGKMHNALRGTTKASWPVDYLKQHGYAVLVSCAGSWAPDAPDQFETHGLKPFLGETVSAISLWSWAIQRLLDVAMAYERIDTENVVVAGHAQLGKAALWAAANDDRIGTVFANAAGVGGSAPDRHEIGESLAEVSTRHPHWFLPQEKQYIVDQHQLIASIAPRKVYLSSAALDAASDPIGTYIALTTAAEVWPERTDWPTADEMWEGNHIIHHPALGHHVRPGDHGLLPYDWLMLFNFLKNA